MANSQKNPRVRWTAVSEITEGLNPKVQTSRGWFPGQRQLEEALALHLLLPHPGLQGPRQLESLVFPRAGAQSASSQLLPRAAV